MDNMKITAIGCLHGEFPDLEGGDLLILTGDLTTNNSIPAWKNFYDWLKKQDYEKKIMIAGNHDRFLSFCASSDEAKTILPPSELPADVEYLCDSGTEYRGLKIWGSPWSLWFKGINPHCMSFTDNEDYLKTKFELIPSDTDILITHTPPRGILDQVQYHCHPKTQQDENGMKTLETGSLSLRDLVLSKKKMPNLKYHFFSHIHECGGKTVTFIDRTFANVSYMDKHYILTNRVLNFEV